MKQQGNVDVAVLLATHNGARYIRHQVESLATNTTRFRLHWLDDLSSDNTRDVVRSVVRERGIELKEWQQDSRQGVPGAFFRLLECVEADIYLFCDQDDIWQPGKIDATVTNLLPEISSPVLSTSDPLLFKDSSPDACYRFSTLIGANPRKALQHSRLFMSTLTHGTTQGFTRPLRDMFMSHKDIARDYAVMHDVWMHNIAVACGTFRLLSDVPTALHRWHTNNSSHAFVVWRGGGSGYMTQTWQQRQWARRAMSRHAQGFILAAATLPQSARLDEIVRIARSVATLHRRQSPVELLRLACLGAMWPTGRFALGFTLSCLCCNAAE